MAENDLDVKSVSDFLALPESVRWQVLFFGLVGVKRSTRHLIKVGYGVLGAILAHAALMMFHFHI